MFKTVTKRLPNGLAYKATVPKVGLVFTVSNRSTVLAFIWAKDRAHAVALFKKHVGPLPKDAAIEAYSDVFSAGYAKDWGMKFGGVRKVNVAAIKRVAASL